MAKYISALQRIEAMFQSAIEISKKYEIIMVTSNEIALVVSDVCPNVYRLSNKEILHGIKCILPSIQTMARNYPELIEQYRDNYRFVTYLDS